MRRGVQKVSMHNFRNFCTLLGVNENLIPKVDLSQSRDAILNSILNAADSGGPGFFYLVNHGIPESVFENAILSANQFFSQPKEFKMELWDMSSGTKTKGYVAPGTEGSYIKDVTDVRPHHEEESLQQNTREAFVQRYPELTGDSAPEYVKNYDQFVRGIEHYDAIAPQTIAWEGARSFFGLNRWPCPNTCPNFQPDITKYQIEITALSEKMFSLFHDVLKITLDQKDDIFVYDQSMKTLNVVHYNPCDDDGSFGIADHTDWEIFTLLYPSYFPLEHSNEPSFTGLEAWFKDRWVQVPHLPGTIIVNQGEMLSRFSNGRLKPPVHRVLAKNTRERYSLVCFSAPNYETFLPDPRASTGKVLCGEFYLKRNAMI